MSLESDINQQRFKNEYQKSVVNMIYTYNWMMERVKQVLGKFDLTPQQFNILRILRGAGGPLSTLQIRQRMLDRMSDTSRIVDRMVVKELASKVVCPGDRRLVDVSITAKGLQLLEQIDRHEAEMEKIFKTLSVEEAQTLNSLLDKARIEEK